MKTIFDQVNPEYLECTTGICGHPEHIGMVIAVILTAFLIVRTKFKKE